MPSNSVMPLPAMADIMAAHQRIEQHIDRTPVVNDPQLDAALGCHLYCKCENLQVVGAFKIRGAMNAVLSLREQGISADVATHSSGNHGAAVAAAARLDGRAAVIVMPDNSVEAKIRNVRRFGGRIEFCAPNQAAREQGLDRLTRQGLVAIHPYDQFEVICGQATAAAELFEQQTGLDTLLAPIGGGGLMAGCSIVARQRQPDMQILGAEPAGAADTAESLRLGRRVEQWEPSTIADGLRALVGEMPFRVIRERLDGVLTVSEKGILSGMDLVWRHLGMLVEPSAATVVAAILEHPGHFAGRSVGAIFTGGNVDLDRFPQFAASPRS